MSAAAYRSVGGFASLPNSEDVAIVGALEASVPASRGARSRASSTSARPVFRATAGFGATLASVAAAAGMLPRPRGDSGGAPA